METIILALILLGSGILVAFIIWYGSMKQPHTGRIHTPSAASIVKDTTPSVGVIAPQTEQGVQDSSSDVKLETQAEPKIETDNQAGPIPSAVLQMTTSMNDSDSSSKAFSETTEDVQKKEEGEIGGIVLRSREESTVPALKDMQQSEVPTPTVEVPTPTNTVIAASAMALPTDVSALSNTTTAVQVPNATNTKMGNFAYCVKCKSKKQIRDPLPVVMKNGRNAVRGLCPDCGIKIFKIGSLS